ncbi:MAG TPA: FAD-binding protein [Armatimonadota bacterium]|jgi:succinate dehydrogenase/fumarate reductase flavoprotein subunit
MNTAETLTIDGIPVPLYRYHTVIIGSGAAGLNCAEHLRDFLGEGASLAIFTSILGGGASHCSGSDKQTYWRLGAVDGAADSPRDMAATIAAGGCMHGDHALAEGEGSIQEFFHLVRNGVPFPQTPLGSFTGYRTDHDPLPRATSAGPWTSRFMVRCSLARVRELGIPIHNSCEVVGLVTEGGGAEQRCAGMVIVDRARWHEENRGLAVVAATNVVMATGGPGELYYGSVYPRSQMGAHGVCFEAGITANNLTESQFGLASVSPRWNLSGTYQQVLPAYYSTNEDGSDERDFLAEVLTDESERLLAIFHKGYQWPFNPQLVAPPESSAVDMLVVREMRAGRRVWMDFRRNPVEPLDLNALPAEARDYLVKSGGTGATPYERLLQMNPGAIDLYRQWQVDLETQPLEIRVSAQHNNGGFAVDGWWESSLPHLFVIGEQAGTHGVTRPGGSALNSGQVGGLRAAQHIAHRHTEAPPVSRASLEQAAAGLLDRLRQYGERAGADEPTVPQMRLEIQQHVTNNAGVLRNLTTLPEACQEARARWEQIRERGVRLNGAHEAARALYIERLALAAWGYLEACRAYAESGGGSRGSYLILDPSQAPVHPAFPELTVRPDVPELRGQVIELRFDGEKWQRQSVPVRPLPEQDNWFESVWRDYREGKVWE